MILSIIKKLMVQNISCDNIIKVTMFNNLRKFIRRNADELDYFYLIGTTKYNSGEDNINAITRIKYRYYNGEFDKLDEKLIKLFDELDKYPKNKNLVKMRRMLSDEFTQPDDSITEYLKILVENQNVPTIVNVLKHLKILMIPQVLRFIIIHVASRYKNDYADFFMKRRPEIIKTLFKIFFKYLYDTNFKDQQYFFDCIKDCLAIALRNNSIEIIHYILTLLGYKRLPTQVDFEIISAASIGYHNHNYEICQWFKLYVNWKSEKLEKTPEYFIHEFFTDKKRLVKNPMKNYHLDDTSFPIYQNVKWYSSSYIPVFTENSSLELHTEYTYDYIHEKVVNYEIIPDNE